MNNEQFILLVKQASKWQREILVSVLSQGNDKVSKEITDYLNDEIRSDITAMIKRLTSAIHADDKGLMGQCEVRMGDVTLNCQYIILNMVIQQYLLNHHVITEDQLVVRIDTGRFLLVSHTQVMTMSEPMQAIRKGDRILDGFIVSFSHPLVLKHAIENSKQVTEPHLIVSDPGIAPRNNTQPILEGMRNGETKFSPTDIKLFVSALLANRNSNDLVSHYQGVDYTVERTRIVLNFKQHPNETFIINTKSFYGPVYWCDYRMHISQRVA